MTTKTERVLPELNKTETSDLEKLPTKSAKIRFLTSKGWKRGDIAAKLGILYQHVRNVQITPVKNVRA